MASVNIIMSMVTHMKENGNNMCVTEKEHTHMLPQGQNTRECGILEDGKDLGN